MAEPGHAGRCKVWVEGEMHHRHVLWRTAEVQGGGGARDLCCGGGIPPSSRSPRPAPRPSFSSFPPVCCVPLRARATGSSLLFSATASRELVTSRARRRSQVPCLHGGYHAMVSSLRPVQLGIGSGLTCASSERRYGPPWRGRLWFDGL